MAGKLEEITIVFRGEKFRKDDWMCGLGDRLVDGKKPEDGKPVSVEISGTCEPGDLKFNQSFRLFGRWDKYKNKRLDQVVDQFKFQTLVLETPKSKEGVVAYLSEAGKGFNVGHAKATKLFDAFGPEAITVARTQPERIQQLLKITSDQASAIAAKLERQKELEGVTVELTGILHGRGFPKAVAAKAIKKWGNEASNVIKKNPFALMVFRGVGFKLCDAMWLDTGNDPAALKRVALLGWHQIASNTDGHTWFPVDIAVGAMAGLADRPKVIKALKLLKRSKACHFERMNMKGVIEPGGEMFIADGMKATHEFNLADCVSASQFEFVQDDFWPDPDEIEGIDGHQKSKVKDSLKGPVCFLGGGPGTGKTYVGAKVVQAIIKKFGRASMAIAAPTGKAAVRITEAMAEHGLQLQARTWHSLLGVEKSPEDDVAGWSFRHNRKNKWPLRLIIGDESSMNDTGLMNSIMQARPSGCHILFIGDVNQLPPVGHGAPLRDLIKAGLPYGELTEIKRNSGGIVEACAAIREQRPWSAGDNLIVTGERKENEQIESMLDHIRQVEAEGLDPIWDCQVIVAVNDRSALSRKKLNEVLQRELNKRGLVKGSPFKIEDKVMNTKNGFFMEIDERTGEPVSEEAECFVANGEMGSVMAVQHKFFVIKLSTPKRFVKVFRGKENKDGGSGCAFILGYAATCHKLQGSEVPVAIVMIDSYPGARSICDRSWLYTAISRAKKRTVLIGQKSVADRMCKSQNIDKRMTLLKQRILKNISEHQVAFI